MAAGDVWGNRWLASWGVSWGQATTPPEPTPQPERNAGVRRARFLRRAPRLPWEQVDEEEKVVSVAPAKRRRIRLPEVEAVRDAVGDAIPVQTVREISAPRIYVPDLGIAELDDDEDILWLI